MYRWFLSRAVPIFDDEGRISNDLLQKRFDETLHSTLAFEETSLPAS